MGGAEMELAICYLLRGTGYLIHSVKKWHKNPTTMEMEKAAPSRSHCLASGERDSNI